MEPRTPEEWWPAFQQAMRAGDLDAVLALYEPDAVFNGRDGRTRTGHAQLREQFAPQAEAKADFQVVATKIIETGDLALLQTQVRITRPQAVSSYALEVLRRQPDGRWLLVIGDPFTVGQQVASGG